MIHLVPYFKSLDDPDSFATVLNQNTPEFEKHGLLELMEAIPWRQMHAISPQDTSGSRGNVSCSVGFATGVNVGRDGTPGDSGCSMPRLLKHTELYHPLFKSMSSIARKLGVSWTTDKVINKDRVSRFRFQRFAGNPKFFPVETQNMIEGLTDSFLVLFDRDECVDPTIAPLLPGENGFRIQFSRNATETETVPPPDAAGLDNNTGLDNNKTVESSHTPGLLGFPGPGKVFPTSATTREEEEELPGAASLFQPLDIHHPKQDLLESNFQLGDFEDFLSDMSARVVAEEGSLLPNAVDKVDPAYSPIPRKRMRKHLSSMKTSPPHSGRSSSKRRMRMIKGVGGGAGARGKNSSSIKPGRQLFSHLDVHNCPINKEVAVLAAPLLFNGQLMARRALIGYQRASALDASVRRCRIEPIVHRCRQYFESLEPGLQMRDVQEYYDNSVGKHGIVYLYDSLEDTLLSAALVTEASVDKTATWGSARADAVNRLHARHPMTIEQYIEVCYASVVCHSSFGYCSVVRMMEDEGLPSCSSSISEHILSRINDLFGGVSKPPYGRFTCYAGRELPRQKLRESLLAMRQLYQTCKEDALGHNFNATDGQSVKKLLDRYTSILSMVKKVFLAGNLSGQELVHLLVQTGFIYEPILLDYASYSQSSPLGRQFGIKDPSVMSKVLFAVHLELGIPISWAENIGCEQGRFAIVFDLFMAGQTILKPGLDSAGQSTLLYSHSAGREPTVVMPLCPRADNGGSACTSSPYWNINAPLEGDPIPLKAATSVDQRYQVCFVSPDACRNNDYEELRQLMAQGAGGTIWSALMSRIRPILERVVQCDLATRRPHPVVNRRRTNRRPPSSSSSTSESAAAGPTTPTRLKAARCPPVVSPSSTPPPSPPQLKLEFGPPLGSHPPGVVFHPGSISKQSPKSANSATKINSNTVSKSPYECELVAQLQFLLLCRGQLDHTDTKTTSGRRSRRGAPRLASLVSISDLRCFETFSSVNTGETASPAGKRRSPRVGMKSGGWYATLDRYSLDFSTPHVSALVDFLAVRLSGHMTYDGLSQRNRWVFPNKALAKKALLVTSLFVLGPGCPNYASVFARKVLGGGGPSDEQTSKVTRITTRAVTFDRDRSLATFGASFCYFVQEGSRVWVAFCPQDASTEHGVNNNSKTGGCSQLMRRMVFSDFHYFSSEKSSLTNFAMI